MPVVQLADFKARGVEHCLLCRLRDKAMDKDRADRKGTDKDRAKLIRNDNELGDEDEDDEPWQRKLMHTR